jgi:hypothetical protein
VALELAEDGRHRERGEGGRPVRLEPVDRLQETERRDLDQVVERLAAALVPTRELTREWQKAFDEGFAGRLVAVAVVPLEQPAVFTRTGATVLRGPRISCSRPMIDRLHAFPVRLAMCAGVTGANSLRRVAEPQPI